MRRIKSIVMDNKNNAFSQLDLAMIPDTGNTLVFGNEFMLGDNLDEPYDTGEASSFIKPNHPFILNFSMLILCTEGYMRINMNLTELKICAGDIFVVLSGSVGECLEISAGCKVVLVAFTAPLGNEVGNFAYVSLMRKQPLLHLPPDELQETLFIYRQMRKKIGQPDYKFTRNVLAGYLQIIFCNVCNNISRLQLDKSAAGVEERTHVLFDRFIELVQQNYEREREIQYYASLMCMTPKYLSRVVYQASGRYAGDWIRDYVILEAKALLKSGKYNVQQVSIKLNFASASFFGKYFKKAVGCSPRRYAAE